MSFVEISARTLDSAVALTGIGLHSGQTVTVRLEAAQAGTGVVFVREDLPGAPEVAVTDSDPQAAPFRMGLKRGAAEVHTVEHLLSALHALGVTDCRIGINGLEVPGMDGSALLFAQAIHAAGLREQGTARALVLHEPVRMMDSYSEITVFPAENFQVSYTLDYPGQPLAKGCMALTITPESYLREVAPARTFAIRKDAEAMRAAGLGKGANFQNTLIIDGDKILETTPRFPDEPVRHKLLDLLGDLYTLGCPLRARVEARCSGHRQNRQLVAKLREIR